ncbi:toxin, partial [Streptomyces sp. NRRL S-444]
CVECAPLGAAVWRKASYSGGTGGDCVEVASQPCLIAVRDSKNLEGPAFTVSPAAFAAFVGAL